ncbi:unnamed protein product [Lactuca virosa]|uniref:Uncharacterized protein n=1 Tax=Lactuca virosa TaxID=75947 RepID=A0AAU9NIQ9_9ASTR|nr:unnamed protein product [Lactuca virosa]
MKREGRQHGVVRSYMILPTTLSQRKYVKTVDSASVAGMFTKVSRKPTNQSKFTGKCGKARCVGCHIHPATKSKDKAKGTMKLRSIGSDPGLIGYPTCTSATGVLADLASDACYDDGDEYDGAIEDCDYDYHEDTNCNVEIGIGLASIVTEEQIGGEDKDDCMSYCDVGLCWGEGDADENRDDGWYLVGDIQQ